MCISSYVCTWQFWRAIEKRVALKLRNLISAVKTGFSHAWLACVDREEKQINSHLARSRFTPPLYPPRSHSRQPYCSCLIPKGGIIGPRVSLIIIWRRTLPRSLCWKQSAFLKHHLTQAQFSIRLSVAFSL